MGKTNKWIEMNDISILKTLGKSLKQERLNQNKTQAQLAKAAGINRWTLGQIEKGESVTLGTFIQILRALNMLEALETFAVNQQISPLEIAKLEKKRRKRASGKNNLNKNENEW